MATRTLKQLFFGTLLGAGLGAGMLASGAYAQADTCVLNLRVFSFVEGTVQTNPIDAELTLTDTKTKKSVEYTAAGGELKLEGLKQSVYQVTAVKDGYRKSIDTINYDCSRSVLYQEGTPRFVTAGIIMWEGDPSKTIRFAQIDNSISDIDRQKDRPIGRFSIGPEDDGITVGTDNKADNKAGNKDAGEVLRSAPVSAGGADNGAPADHTGKTVSKGVINGFALVLAKPNYPPTAKAVGASGAVSVQVTIDEEGYIIAASAVSGHPLLKGVSTMAARASRFRPTLLAGTPVKVSGIIIYNFL